jgi:NAD(P)-dependent dehydrogenase (short-subunit alcohol dehydrogenase family)
MLSLTRSVAADYGSAGIRSNVVAPGLIRSAFVNKYLDRYQQLAQASPAGRVGEPSEVAATIAFLASEEAPYITGESINISGGLYLRP